MNLDQVILRRFEPGEDISRLLSLHQAVEIQDQPGGPPVSEEKLRQQLTLPGHNPDRDRMVACLKDDPAQVIGYNLVWLPPQATEARANIIVHPAWRHQGLGSRLMQQLLEHARQLGATQVTIGAHHTHPVAGAFLRKHGFLPIGTYTEMRAPADQLLPPTVWPYGYTVRPYSEINDLATLTQVFNESYADLWGHYQVSQEQMAGYLAEFDPRGLFLVFSEKNRPVGVCRVEMSAERTNYNGAPTGYIDSPGIYSPHRRLDLYRALLLTGMKWLQKQGSAWIELESWGDRQEVLRSYFDLGFTISRQVVEYQKAL
jgi:mycothiol synthase